MKNHKRNTRIQVILEQTEEFQKPARFAQNEVWMAQKNLQTNLKY